MSLTTTPTVNAAPDAPPRGDVAAEDDIRTTTGTSESDRVRDSSKSSTVLVCPDTQRTKRRYVLGYDVDRAITDHDLREEVLALPAKKRARIASDLLASVDSETVDEDEIDQLWSAETQRRAAMLESGDAGTLTWDDIQERFAERSAQR